ncbi:HET-domain-containing protein, partial [Lentithecium fluviatile CBS 122367]
MAAIYEAHPLHFGASTKIRVVELLPNDSSDLSAPISCKFHVLSLDEAPPYTALSYVWGDATVTKTILLDGEPFSVRVNLWNFLMQKRAEGDRANTDSSFLWIDAICIDQTSIAERNHQVSMMGRIYSEATSVIAWLGIGPESITSAMKQIKLWSRMDEGAPNWISLAFDSIRQLSTSEYWTRVWIVQEFVLGK